MLSGARYYKIKSRKKWVGFLVDVFLFSTLLALDTHRIVLGSIFFSSYGCGRLV